MASQEDHVKMFRSFIRANGNSENVCNLYWKRVRTFLAKHPEAMELDKDALKSLVDDYISAIPITSGIEVTATAVRYYWTMRFGERWCKRFDPKDYPTSEAIEKECSEFAVYLQSLGYLSVRTVHDRTNKVKRFLYVMFDSGFDRGKVCLASVMAYLAEGMPGMSASTRRGFCTEVRSYARFLASRGCVETAGPISRMRLTGPAIADKLPDCIADCDYAAMIASIDTSSARGKRDLAMLMLMGNLGLRRSDAALLDVGDVDWANGVLHVRNSKSQSDRSIPIDAVTGKALEDYALDIMIGKGPSAQSIRINLPRFTLVGATTRAGQITGPLRDRFGVLLKLELYGPDELARIIMRSAGILDQPITPEGAYELAKCSRGTPRVANRFLKRIRDFATVLGDGVIDRDVALMGLKRMDVDALGLDELDRSVLRAIIEMYNGGPVGLETLAAALGEEAVTLEDLCEPYLMQMGFLTRTPRGRCVTRLAYEHLGMKAPESGAPEDNGQQSLF